MAEYNPNSVWTGKKKDPAYRPSAVQPAAASKTGEAKSVVAKDAEPSIETGKAAEPFFKKRPIGEAIEEESGGRGHKGLWWTLGIMAAVVLGGLGYLFFHTPSGANVSFEYSKPDQILVGDKFILTVTFSNYSPTILKNATLSVKLPDNVSFIGQSADQRVLEQVVGDLGPQSINRQDFNLIVTGDPNTVKHVETKLTYSTDASLKSQFETDSGVDLVVGGPAIALNFAAPTTVFSGQDFDMVVTYNNNTNHSFQDVRLMMQYPPAYVFTESTMAPMDPGSRTWDLGTIPAAGTGTITISGHVIGPNGATYTLEGNLAGNISGDTYTLTDQTASFGIGSSPLGLSIAVNNSSDYVAKTSDSLTYDFSYTNTSNVTFQNVALSAQLTGDMYDLSSLQSNGSFNSITNTVTWSAANTPAFLNLAPGQSGTVEFRVRTKSSYPIRLLSDKNYTLKVNAQVSSPTVPPGTAASTTVNAASLETKVGGAIMLASKGYWRDAASNILNTGPYPPTVNQPTEYTIHWIITNYATDAQNVTVNATLQSGTTCTGTIKSNMATSPTCNPANGQVSWTIPVVAATTGVTGKPAEAIIQVTNTPAVNQIGSAVTLMGPATLSATDGFTGNQLSASAPPVTTDLPDDKTVAASTNRRVTQ